MSDPRRVVPLLLAALASWTNVAAAEPYRLDEAVHQALATNERALKAPLRVEVAEGQAERARDGFLPTFVGGTSTTIQPTGSKVVSLPTSFVVNQPILNPSLIPLFAQAKHNLESEKWGATQDRRQLQFDVARAFLQALSAEHLLAAAQHRVETATANLDNAQARVDAKLASSNDVTRAQVALASAQAGVATAQGAVERAYVQLDFVVGVKVPRPLARPEAMLKTAMAFEVDPKAQLDAAMSRRPDLKAAHARTEGLKDFAAEPLYRLAPTIGASGTLKIDPTATGAVKPIDGTLSVNLTWTIFDAGFRYADRRTRIAQAESAALDEKAIRRQVEADIATALVTLRAARETLRIADAAVEATQRNIDETLVLYNRDLAKAIEVADANSSRFDAEVTRANAMIATEQAYLDLRQALGFGPVDEDETVAKK
jgi:outer membrane protein TolC